MYAKRIIPCLDVKNGRVVKGMSFVNLVDAGDPVESAMQYDKQGADELVFLDITASSDSRNITIDMVEKVANSIFIPFTVGGGIRSVEDFNVLLRAGADKVSVNSAAVHINFPAVAVSFGIYSGDNALTAEFICRLADEFGTMNSG